MSDDPFGFCAEPECEDEPELPPLKRQVLDFLGTAWDVIQGVFMGNGVRVDRATYYERINTCKGCEFFIKDSQRCSQCGCFMETKTKFKKAYCPVGKWESVK